jgi:hypothetical protein
MPRVKDRTISQRLTWMNMLVCGVALLLACSAFIGYDLVTFRTARVNNLSMQAQILASNTMSALVFDDPDSAGKTLSALKADPQQSTPRTDSRLRPMRIPEVPQSHRPLKFRTDNSSAIGSKTTKFSLHAR